MSSRCLSLVCHRAGGFSALFYVYWAVSRWICHLVGLSRCAAALWPLWAPFVFSVCSGGHSLWSFFPPGSCIMPSFHSASTTKNVFLESIKNQLLVTIGELLFVLWLCGKGNTASFHQRSSALFISCQKWIWRVTAAAACCDAGLEWTKLWENS